MFPMKVRYNVTVGVVFIVLGAVCSFLGLWLLLLGEFNPAVVVGLLPALMGILYLVRPYFLVDRGVVTVPALIGPAKRQFPFARLEVDGGKVVAVTSEGTRKKVPVARWMAHPADWRAVTGGVR
jgi:hypothetical protein